MTSVSVFTINGKKKTAFEEAKKMYGKQQIRSGERSGTTLDEF